MNKKDYTGWQDVFRFSFEQGIKAKSFIVSLAIMSIITMLALPVMTFITNREAKAVGQTEIETVYIYDETGLPIDYSKALTDERYEGIKLDTAPSKTADAYAKDLEEAEKPGYVVLKVTHEESGYFQLSFVKGAKASFSDKDYEAMQDDFVSFFQEAKRDAIEVTPEQEAYINQPVQTSVEFAGVNEDGELTIAPKEKTEGVSMAEYNILLFSIVIVMLIINLAGGQIANGIVTEKSTRVVEYLMINVRPLALIVGKILASLLMVIIQLGAMGVSYFIGKTISDTLMPASGAEETGMLAEFLEKMSGVTVPQLLIAVAAILCGVMFFCIIAGLAGASVSKVDELAEGMKSYQLLLVAGSYIGIGVCIVEMVGNIDPKILDLLSIIPISAPFVIPANLMLGKIGLLPAAIGTALLAALTVALFVFTSKVYESMIFYNGKVLKLKDIIMLAKNKKSVKKEEK